MKGFEMSIPYGNERHQAVISQPDGIGGDWWKVNIDNYYEGTLHKRRGYWEAGHLPAKSILTTADIQAIGEMIDQEYGKAHENEL
ncbi:MAG: hypothetical protein ACXVIY_00980 [Mucilaginibacter sp.]